MIKPPPNFKDHPFYEPVEVPLARPWLDTVEISAAAEVVRSGFLCQGQKTAEFEQEFANKLKVRQAVAVSSGSAALLVALQAMGVGSGDEVIAPNMTFVSTATAAMYLGGRPVFCDITLEDYCIDPAKIGALINEQTKVIIPVHYAGQTADMAPLMELAKRNNLFVLEDAAEAHLARYQGKRFAGTIGHAGIFSFTPTKPMTTGEGGMIVTDDEELAEKCRLIRNFGDSHKFAWDTLGFNFRINEVASVLGLGQLAKLEQIIARRRAIARKYDESFGGHDLLRIPWVRGPEDCNYQLYTVMLQMDKLRISRDQVIAELLDRGVATRLYYPALHRMGVFEPFGPFDDRQFSNSIAFESGALSLPIFTELSSQQQDHVIRSLLSVLDAHRR